MPDLTKPQRCVMMRNGIELWIDEKLAQKLQTVLEAITEHKFVIFEGRTINTADCTGIYLPEDRDASTRRKNGEWQCAYGKWHERNGRCGCISEQEWLKKKQYRQQHFQTYGFYPLD